MFSTLYILLRWLGCTTMVRFSSEWIEHSALNTKQTSMIVQACLEMHDWLWCFTREAKHTHCCTIFAVGFPASRCLIQIEQKHSFGCDGDGGDDEGTKAITTTIAINYLLHGLRCRCTVQTRLFTTIVQHLYSTEGGHAWHHHLGPAFPHHLLPPLSQQQQQLQCQSSVSGFLPSFLPFPRKCSMINISARLLDN